MGARGAAHGIARNAEIRKLTLEILDLGTQNVVLRRAHPAHSGQHFGTHLLILWLQIKHRHRVRRRCAAGQRPRQIRLR